MGRSSLEQLRRFGLSPDTSYGQHFLIDDNILGVATRLARVTSEDVVYEPGAGVGVLTAHLAETVAHVHAVELDDRLRAALDSIEQEHSNVTVHWGDAMQLDIDALEPPPTALVSNLPYHVAAPIVAEALRKHPSLVRGCVMVQREVGERMYAPVGSKTYGGLSVLVQAVTERTGTHAVARTVFAPPPNVDSMLVGFVRRDPATRPLADADADAFGGFVRGCFGQRRKTLANNLIAIGAATREQTEVLLPELGHSRTARPQELAADEFVALHAALTSRGTDT